MKRIWSAAVFFLLLGLASSDRAREEPVARVGNWQESDEVPVLMTLPPFALTDQSGAQFGTQALQGKVWVANFIFTRCMATCPVQTAQMAQLQQRLKSHARWSDISLVSISVDPQYDQPSVLQQYARNSGADERNWRFLTGQREQIWQLSKDGFKLPVGENPGNEDMPLFHAPHLVLVDWQGRVRGYYDGLTAEGVERLARGLDKVLEEFASAARTEDIPK